MTFFVVVADVNERFHTIDEKEKNNSKHLK